MSENSREPDWRSLYFMPGQIVFLVASDARESSKDEILNWANRGANRRKLQVTNLRTQYFPPAPPRQPREEKAVPPAAHSGGRRVRISPPVAERGAFTLVHADVLRLEDGERLGSEESDNSALLDLIWELDDSRKEILGGSVQVVSPNWLTISSPPEPGGTGGPGGRPTPYTGSSSTDDYKFHFAEPADDDVYREFYGLQERGTGEGVDVAILDTAPGLELDELYDTWSARGHLLIGSLLDPNDRRLTVHREPRLLDPAIKELPCIGHKYRMNDHGIFVAGIIHSLAPRARLHLYQVLNEYGVGSLEIIGDALQKVIQEFGNGPLVVNLSLTFDIPIDKAHTRLGRPHVLDVLGEKLLAHGPSSPKKAGHDPSWIARAAWLTEWICDLVYALGSGVIAAAGNDYYEGQHGPQRPQARYPAAFDRVVGVGALPRLTKPPSTSAPLATARYSNLSDRPERSGIATLGGEEGPGEGLLGIYVEKFPDGSSSTNGWAWWCGTSFATPIISGATAAVLSSMLADDQGTTVEEAVGKLFAAQEFVTKANEDVLYLTQGSTPGSN